MPRREFHRHGIFNLTIRKNAVQKAVSETIDGPLNACALYKIDTDTEDTHLVRRADYLGVVGLARRLPFPEMATGAVALQFYRQGKCSSGIPRHRGEHFFHGGL